MRPSLEPLWAACRCLHCPWPRRRPRRRPQPPCLLIGIAGTAAAGARARAEAAAAAVSGTIVGKPLSPTARAHPRDRVVTQHTVRQWPRTSRAAVAREGVVMAGAGTTAPVADTTGTKCVPGLPTPLQHRVARRHSRTVRQFSAPIPTPAPATTLHSLTVRAPCCSLLAGRKSPSLPPSLPLLLHACHEGGPSKRTRYR